MNNIEDDIEKIKTFADYSQEVLNDMEYEKPVDVTITQKEVNAINNLLSEREQDTKRIKELEEKNRMLVLEGSRVRLDLYIKQNYIPKQAIKDKIEEINKKYEDSKDENGESPYYYPEYTIRVLKKLLQESEE